MKFLEKMQLFYIKHIKRWMFCPVCHNKLYKSKDRNVWECSHCEYILADKDFTNNFVFWFCDECESYLNIQDGFNEEAGSWRCKKCGYVNELTDDSLIDNLMKQREEIFDTLSEEQKEITYSIVGLARQGLLDKVDVVEYVNIGERDSYETVGEFFEHLDKKQRILVRAMIGQAIEDYESEMRG